MVQLEAEICFPLAGSATSVRDNSKKVEDLAPFAMFVHAVIADVWCLSLNSASKKNEGG